MGQAPRIVRWTLPALLLTLVVGGALIITSSGIGDKPNASEPAPAPAPRTETTRRKTPTTKRVTVRSGDTASAIAERADLTLDQLIERNPKVDLNTLRPGQKLKTSP